MRITQDAATSLLNNALEKYPYLIKYSGMHQSLIMELLLAQMRQESAFDPDATSIVGAKGLMQVMPATASDILEKIDIEVDWLSPQGNVLLGVWYMTDIYKRFGEIPDSLERYKMSLASYNGGRGYVNVMLGLARASEGIPRGFSAWRREGKPAGCWQTWDYASKYLDKVVLRGKSPDHKQMTDYVKKIIGFVPVELLKLRS